MTEIKPFRIYHNGTKSHYVPVKEGEVGSKVWLCYQVSRDGCLLETEYQRVLVQDLIPHQAAEQVHERAREEVTRTITEQALEYQTRSRKAVQAHGRALRTIGDTALEQARNQDVSPAEYEAWRSRLQDRVRRRIPGTAKAVRVTAQVTWEVEVDLECTDQQEANVICANDDGGVITQAVSGRPKDIRMNKSRIIDRLGEHAAPPLEGGTPTSDMQMYELYMRDGDEKDIVIAYAALEHGLYQCRRVLPSGELKSTEGDHDGSGEGYLKINANRLTPYRDKVRRDRAVEKLALGYARDHYLNRFKRRCAMENLDTLQDVLVQARELGEHKGWDMAWVQELNTMWNAQEGNHD